MAETPLACFSRETIASHHFIIQNKNLNKVVFSVISNYIYVFNSLYKSIHLYYICNGLVACIYCISAVNLSKILARGISLGDGTPVICRPANMLLGISVLSGFHIFYNVHYAFISEMSWSKNHSLYNAWRKESRLL